MKTIVAGSRSITSYPVVALAILRSGFEITEVVSGGARGVDLLGEQWALVNGVYCVRFPAHWDRLGKRAGHERNHQMSHYANALIAVWDGRSAGTKDMISIARSNLMPVYVHTL